MEDLKNYYGRLWTESQLDDGLKKYAQTMPAMTEKFPYFICNRCGSKNSSENTLPDGSIYCRGCLVFGRISSQEKLFYFEQQAFPKIQALSWQGQLTALQQEVSDSLRKAVKQKENILVHAVTGAGKTEIVYGTLADTLEEGKAAALVSPRVDVCLELYKRLSRDFSCPISLLHAQSEAYERSPLVIATTHQLLRFYQAFDLLIVDEVDAFPFADNKMLQCALERCLKPDGVKVYLTATSTAKLDRQIKQGQLKKLHLARRFHANPLVVPKTIWLAFSLEKLGRQKLPVRFLSYVRKQRQSRFPLLIFFPHIELGALFTESLKKYFPDESIDFVSSLSPDRLEKVDKFRKEQIQILVSTTILERGVTFPNIDVFVMMANHRLFTKTALIQIAGRVGRSADRPTGTLIFFHNGLNKAIKKAILEIKEMNQKGGFV
ncbi:DEAD/DEAH box helicase [Streptococcus orisasini]|uniref:DEAD/DEAH box helicase n=1 Tax=Streptococcus orisasini TaxID=1080071 RepID=UPI00070E4AC0|nr:DEAD/DEAH box helicase [Streptococcus orisasini]